MTNGNKVHSRKGHLAAQAVVLAALLTTIGSIFACTRSDQQSASAPEKATIAYTTSTDAVLAQVAQIKGYYLREGLNVVPHVHTYGKPALDEVLEGKADFATVAETPVMFAIMKGAKISVIATILTSNKYNAIVARKDKGILSPQDLKGRKIAATLGTTSDFFMDAFLTTHGISRQDLKVVDGKPQEMEDTLVNGDVDAVSLFNPNLVEVEKKLGNKVVAFYDENIYTLTFNVVARQDFIQKNPDMVKKVLRALMKAEEFVRQSPAEAQQLVADSSKMDIALLRDVWADADFSVSLDQSLVLALEDESRWAIENRLIRKTTIPNYLDYIYFGGLESLKPRAVRILR